MNAITTDTHPVLTALVTDELVDAYIGTHSIPVPSDMDLSGKIALGLRLGGTKTQSGAAATVINMMKGQIAGRDLTAVLRELYPNNHKIGKQHGPYYLSHARSGKLKGCKYVPAKGTTSAAPAASVVANKEQAEELAQVKSDLNDALATVAALKRVLDQIGDCRGIREVRKVMQGVDLSENDSEE